jgi:nicotinamidase/pyrazinamidase
MGVQQALQGLRRHEMKQASPLQESSMARFVIVVDTQVDFIAADGALSVRDADTLVEPMRAWLRGLDPVGTAGVLFTFDTHTPEVYAHSAEAKAFPIHCVRGTEGWGNVLDVALLDPAIPAWRIEKGVFDMWSEDGLSIENARDPVEPGVSRERFFDDIAARGIVDVTVIGVAADYCVRWAIDGLIARGFRVEIPEGLTRGIDRQIGAVVEDEFAREQVLVS